MTDAERRHLHRALDRAPRPPAVVLDVSFVNGLDAIRSLARAGAPVLAVDHRPAALGFRSRLAVPLRSPDPDDEGAYVRFLQDIAGELPEPAVVFPTHDAPLGVVARHANELRSFTLPGSGWDVLEPLQRKRHQLEAAARAGVGIPRTYYPTSRAEAVEASRELEYPAIVKPSEGIAFKRRFGRPVIVCQSAGELVAAYAAAAGSAPMLQEVVPGGDDSLWTVGTYTDAAGRALGVFCGRKLLQMPRGFGTCRVGEARWRDDAVEQAIALLGELGYHGIAQTELRLDARDGRLKLMEVNPRLWQWHGLARACGVDLPRMAYDNVLGDSLAPARSGPDCDGRRWVAAAAHLRHSRGEGEGLGASLRPLLGRGVVEATFDRRDPLPAVVAAAALLPPAVGRRLGAARRGLAGAVRGWRG